MTPTSTTTNTLRAHSHGQVAPTFSLAKKNIENYVLFPPEMSDSLQVNSCKKTQADLAW